MTTILASTFILTAAVTFGAKLFKAHIDWHYPACDDEGEIEAFLARSLAAALEGGDQR